MNRLKSFFLPAGIITAGIAALISPEQGAWLKQAGVIPLFIIIIFLVNGYNLKLENYKFEKGFFKTFIWAALVSLILGPFLGKIIGTIAGLNGVFALGLVVMSSMPSTLSSGIVITEVSGGNRIWALFLTVSLNITGIFTIPMMLNLVLKENMIISVSPWPLFLKLLLYVLVPLLAGRLARKLTPDRDFSRQIKYIPSICVILTVWVSLSASSSLLLSVSVTNYLYIITGAAGVHLILLFLNGAAGKFLLRLKKKKENLYFL